MIDNPLAVVLMAIVAMWTLWKLPGAEIEN